MVSKDNSRMIYSQRGFQPVETKAVMKTSLQIDERFLRVIETLFHCTERVVATGVGTSGAVAKWSAHHLSGRGKAVTTEGDVDPFGMMASGNSLVNCAACDDVCKV